jgi:hypothetical protein
LFKSSWKGPPQPQVGVQQQGGQPAPQQQKQGKTPPVKPPPNQASLLQQVNSQAHQREVMGNPMDENLVPFVDFKSYGQIPQNITDQFDAHGTDLNGLTNLLNNGIDPSRTFYTGLLTGAWSQAAAAAAIAPHSSNFVCLSHAGMTLRDGGIPAVAVAPLYVPFIPQLKEAFPGIKFFDARETPTLLPKVASHGSGKKVDYGHRFSFEDWNDVDATFSWVRHQGEQGGRGWKSTVTGEIRYQEAMPTEREGAAPQTATPRQPAASTPAVPAPAATQPAQPQGVQPGQKIEAPPLMPGGQEAAQPAQPKELPAGTIYQAAVGVADKHYKNMRFLLANLAREQYNADDALADVETYQERALEANARAWDGRYGRFKNNASHYYPAEAFRSPEWQKVKEAFRASRDRMADHIEEMAAYVRAIAGATKATGKTRGYGDDIAGMGREHSNAITSSLRGQEEIYAALNALDKKFPRTSKPTGRHLFSLVEPPLISFGKPLSLEARRLDNYAVYLRRALRETDSVFEATVAAEIALAQFPDEDQIDVPDDFPEPEPVGTSDGKPVDAMFALFSRSGSPETERVKAIAKEILRDFGFCMP